MKQPDFRMTSHEVYRYVKFIKKSLPKNKQLASLLEFKRNNEFQPDALYDMRAAIKKYRASK